MFVSRSGGPPHQVLRALAAARAIRVRLGALVRKPRQTGLKKSANRCGSELDAFAGRNAKFPDPPAGRKHWLDVCRRENEQRTRALVVARATFRSETKMPKRLDLPFWPEGRRQAGLLMFVGWRRQCRR